MLGLISLPSRDHVVLTDSSLMKPPWIKDGLGSENGEQTSMCASKKEGSATMGRPAKTDSGRVTSSQANVTKELTTNTNKPRKLPSSCPPSQNRNACDI